MRRSLRFAPALIVGVCIVQVAFAQGKPPRERAAAKIAPADAAAEQQKSQKLQAILKQWEFKSAGLGSLDIRFTREDISPGWDGEDGPTKFRGRALLQSPDRAILRFEKLERVKGQQRYTAHEDIILTGQHVLQYAYPTRQIFVHPLAKDARQRILEEGPLPFLFKMRASELERRFRLNLASETTNAYIIEVHPLLEYDQETFIGAHLWLNKRSFLPDKLRFYAPNKKDQKEYTFGGIVENPQLDPNLFRGTKLEGWTVHENPGPDPAQRGAAAHSRRPTPR